MRIRSPRDFWCGLLFFAIGVAFVVLAQEYRMGTAQRMGPAYFPTLLGGLLALLGLSIAGPALAVTGPGLPHLHWRPLAFVLLGIVAFGLLLAPLGLAAAIADTVVIGGLADPQLRLHESAGLAVFLAAFSVGIFVGLLGLPLAIWPSF